MMRLYLFYNLSVSQFAEHYLVESPRLKNWDYSSPGIYFITICTVHHNKFFGKIANNQMELSEMGVIAQECLSEIPKHFPKIRLNDFVIMPNHVHLLIQLSKHVETHHDASLRKKYQNYHFHRLAIKSTQIIPLVIKQFKSAVTKKINPKTIFFGWQSRFYDQIVKDKAESAIIRNYIQNNITNWTQDKFYN
jgi:putative transposase